MAERVPARFSMTSSRSAARVDGHGLKPQVVEDQDIDRARHRTFFSLAEVAGDSSKGTQRPNGPTARGPPGLNVDRHTATIRWYRTVGE